MYNKLWDVLESCIKHTRKSVKSLTDVKRIITNTFYNYIYRDMILLN